MRQFPFSRGIQVLFPQSIDVGVESYEAGLEHPTPLDMNVIILIIIFLFVFVSY